MNKEMQIKIGSDLFEHSVRIETLRQDLGEAQVLVYQTIELLEEAYKGTAAGSMLTFLESLYHHLGRLSLVYESSSSYISKTDEVMHMCDSAMAGDIMNRIVKKYS